MTDLIPRAEALRVVDDEMEVCNEHRNENRQDGFSTEKWDARLDSLGGVRQRLRAISAPDIMAIAMRAADVVEQIRTDRRCGTCAHEYRGLCGAPCYTLMVDGDDDPDPRPDLLVHRDHFCAAWKAREQPKPPQQPPRRVVLLGHDDGSATAAAMKGDSR